MKALQLKNVIWKEGDFYVAQCLNVEVSSFGSSKVEALANLEEALSLYFHDNEEPLIHDVDQPELTTVIIK